MSVLKQVIAMGDGGVDANAPLMDLYILAQTQSKRPKVCFLGTASGDNAGYAGYFEKVFSRYPCVPTHLSLFNPHVSDIHSFIMSQDVIYVGGGHTKSMLGVWREWGLDKILREAYENGVVLSGGSAGSVCWFDQCITDSIPGSLTVMNCLGILPYSNCPHFASQKRRNSYSRLIIDSKIKNGYAADDYAAIHFIDGKCHRAVGNRIYAKAHKLGLENGAFYHKKIKTHWLGSKEVQQEFIWNSPQFQSE